MNTIDPAALQPERIVLLPPNHEQSWPTFHVDESDFEDFLEYLQSHEIKLMQEPEPLGPLGPRGQKLYEVEVSDDHSVEYLDKLLTDFLK